MCLDKTATVVNAAEAKLRMTVQAWNISGRVVHGIRKESPKYRAVACYGEYVSEAHDL